ncbi:hypothetical protein Golomagni_07101, partial [Golovinomyces magnicellulatus]
KHTIVPVNTAETVKISGEHGEVELNVRIQDYKGLPYGSPNTSPYFSTEPHAYNQDQYSISFRFTPKKAASASGDEEDGILGTDLQFGNDFDRPIRDKLPPGFSTAMSIVKWWIDPGLDGDAYADKPYLYGPALSSFNTLNIGNGIHDEEKGGLWFEEGGDEAGVAVRDEISMPDTSKARMKWALNDDNKKKFIFKYGQTYGVDFYNPYLDFANLALKLPGFHLPIAKYWDGQGLRYVLRNKTSGDVYLVVVFTLFLKEDVNEDGSIKDGVDGKFIGEAHAEDEHDHDADAALKAAREQFGEPHSETTADDVD